MVLKVIRIRVIISIFKDISYLMYKINILYKLQRMLSFFFYLCFSLLSFCFWGEVLVRFLILIFISLLKLNNMHSFLDVSIIYEFEFLG